MITELNMQIPSTCVAPMTHAHVQGAAVVSRLRATVVQLSPAFGAVPATGLPISTDGNKYGGPGSRAWSPPV